jgi:hypothetical protein
MTYYIIDRKIKGFEVELDTNLYSYPTLTQEQTNFYLAHPNASYSEVINMTVYPTPTVSLLDRKEGLKQYFDMECQNEILQEYPLHKQLNITNLNGYSEDDLFDMNTFIANQRSKATILKEIVDASENEQTVLSLTWDISLDDLVSMVVSSENPNSLQVAKSKAVNDLNLWVKQVSDLGYYDSSTGVTLAARESDVDAFAKDLTGISSLIRESTYNENINLPQYWGFLDKDKNAVQSLTPTQYVSLLNRYFVSVRDSKMAYSYYLYLILSASSLEGLSQINFGG